MGWCKMAIVTISLTLDTTAAPNVTTHLIAAAQEWMDAQVPPIVYGSMTPAQKVKTYIRGILTDVVKQRQCQAGITAAQSAVNASVNSIITEVGSGLT